jgi:outer membrane protein assembly factor BamA
VVHATEPDSASVKRVKVYPFPAIGYSPETRWYVGAVALFNLRLSENNLDKPSTVELEFNYTQNKQFIYAENHELRFGENKFLFTGENGYFRYPEYYWTEGYDDESDTDDIKTEYDADRVEIDNTFMTKIRGWGPFAGIRFRYHYMEILSADEPFDYEPGTEFRAAGLGPSFVFDTRDNPLNATKGFYFSGNALFFSDFFDGAYAFQKAETDFRIYAGFRNKSVLAFQGVLNGSWGSDIPFRMLSLMGGERIMRGYYLGRYRDNHLFATQAEYRAPIWKWFGATVFLGHGLVYGEENSDNLVKKFSYGAGLRFRIDKKDNVNLRFDYGMGKNTSGFYISFGEAF